MKVYYISNGPIAVKQQTIALGVQWLVSPRYEDDIYREYWYCVIYRDGDTCIGVLDHTKQLNDHDQD